MIEELLAADTAPISSLRLKVGEPGVREARNPLEDVEARSERQPLPEFECHDREIAFGFCTCRLLPTGRQTLDM